MGGLEVDEGCLARGPGLIPPANAETPGVPGSESGKPGTRSGEVVALSLGVLQELRNHECLLFDFYADGFPFPDIREEMRLNRIINMFDCNGKIYLGKKFNFP